MLLGGVWGEAGSFGEKGDARAVLVSAPSRGVSPWLRGQVRPLLIVETVVVLFQDSALRYAVWCPALSAAVLPLRARCSRPRAGDTCMVANTEDTEEIFFCVFYGMFFVIGGDDKPALRRDAFPPHLR